MAHRAALLSDSSLRFGPCRACEGTVPKKVPEAMMRTMTYRAGHMGAWASRIHVCIDIKRQYIVVQDTKWYRG